MAVASGNESRTDLSLLRHIITLRPASHIDSQPKQPVAMGLQDGLVRGRHGL